MCPRLDIHMATRKQPWKGGVLLIGEKIEWQGETTPGQDRHQTVVAERTDQAIERHRRDMIERGTPLQTEATVRGQQRITSHRWWHLAVAEDKVGEDREHRFARRALDAPDGDPTQPDTRIMRMACQAPSPATGRLVLELKAEGEKERQHTFEKRLAISHQAAVGGFVSKMVVFQMS
jgi:hypothetical protein